MINDNEGVLIIGIMLRSQSAGIDFLIYSFILKRRGKKQTFDNGGESVPLCGISVKVQGFIQGFMLFIVYLGKTNSFP